MSNQADIRDIQILGDLKAAFGRFSEDVLQILPAIQKQFEEIEAWLEERQTHWQQQVDEAEDLVHAARRALGDCESSGYYDDEGDYQAPNCSSEEDEVQETEQHLAECEKNLETVKQWRHRIEGQIADFQNDMHRLSILASSRTGSAQAALVGKLEILNRYVGGGGAVTVGTSGLQGQTGNVRIGSRQEDNPELHRPFIRKEVRAEVERCAPKTSDGRFIDPNTFEPIDGKYDLGHKHGNEFRTLKAQAQAERLTQEDFNKRMNDPDLYQIESISANRSHRFEQKENT